MCSVGVSGAQTPRPSRSRAGRNETDDRKRAGRALFPALEDAARTTYKA